jgi:hypothetical protein
MLMFACIACGNHALANPKLVLTIRPIKRNPDAPLGWSSDDTQEAQPVCRTCAELLISRARGNEIPAGNFPPFVLEADYLHRAYDQVAEDD